MNGRSLLIGAALPILCDCLNYTMPLHTSIHLSRRIVGISVTIAALTAGTAGTGLLIT